MFTRSRLWKGSDTGKVLQLVKEDLQGQNSMYCGSESSPRSEICSNLVIIRSHPVVRLKYVDSDGLLDR